MLEELGHYIPAFFKMKVKVDGDIDLNNMSLKDFSVFFHEYIHFIQDFTTAAGCRRIYVYGEFIRQCVQQITKGSSPFIVPVNVPDLENNVLPNFNLLDRVEGDRKPISVVVIKDVDTIPEEIDDKDGNKLKFESLYFTTIGDEPRSVGTYAIKESMAYLVEQVCTTDHVESDDFPYNIARLISDYILGKEMLDDITLLALCDVSLLTSNPGLSFYRLLCMIRNKRMVVTKPEDVYEYFYQNNSVTYDTKQMVLSIMDYFQSAGLALNAVKAYYTLDKLKDLNEWLDKVFSLGMALRLERPYFMIEMARASKDKANGVLQFFAKEIGSPLMENSQGLMYKLRLPSGEPPTEYIYILQQFYNLFKSGVKSCGMKSWCTQKQGLPLAPADERCDTAPWSRCRDKNLCPYALFWHHRKLSGFEPK